MELFTETCTSEIGEITSALMQNPEVLAAVKNRLGPNAGIPSEYIASLPKVVKRRIKSLKKLQHEMMKIESKFYEEVHELECKYAPRYQPLTERRKVILTGGVEPTDSDCDWPSDEEESTNELADELKKRSQKEDAKEEKEGENPSVIICRKISAMNRARCNLNRQNEEHTPLNPLNKDVSIKHNSSNYHSRQDHDEPILSHLQDIKVKFSEYPVGFTLEFYFDQNDYFTNAVLTKEYILKTELDPADPLSYEGPEISKCKGCAIDWKKGKNVTLKLIKKIQKHKGRGAKRTVTKTVQNDSFFNFFSPPQVTEGEEPDEDTETLLADDFETGHFLRERVVPRAVLYFTGETIDDEFEDEEAEDEDDDEEYDEDNDTDNHPRVRSRLRAART